MTIHYMRHRTDLIYIMRMAKEHLPPMNKFARKLHRYIVYLLLSSKEKAQPDYNTPQK